MLVNPLRRVLALSDYTTNNSVLVSATFSISTMDGELSYKSL